MSNKKHKFSESIDGSGDVDGSGFGSSDGFFGKSRSHDLSCGSSDGSSDGHDLGYGYGVSDGYGWKRIKQQ